MLKHSCSLRPMPLAVRAGSLAGRASIIIASAQSVLQTPDCSVSLILPAFSFRPALRIALYMDVPSRVSKQVLDAIALIRLSVWMPRDYLRRTVLSYNGCTTGARRTTVAGKVHCGSLRVLCRVLSSTFSADTCTVGSSKQCGERVAMSKPPCSLTSRASISLQRFCVRSSESSWRCEVHSGAACFPVGHVELRADWCLRDRLPRSGRATVAIAVALSEATVNKEIQQVSVQRGKSATQAHSALYFDVAAIPNREVPSSGLPFSGSGEQSGVALAWGYFSLHFSTAWPPPLLQARELSVFRTSHVLPTAPAATASARKLAIMGKNASIKNPPNDNDPWVCPEFPQCIHMSSQHQNVLEHYVVKHTDEKPHYCTFLINGNQPCPKRFASGKDSSNHKRSAHGYDSKTATTEERSKHICRGKHDKYKHLVLRLSEKIRRPGLDGAGSFPSGIKTEEDPYPERFLRGPVPPQTSQYPVRAHAFHPYHHPRAPRAMDPPSALGPGHPGVFGPDMIRMKMEEERDAGRRVRHYSVPPQPPAYQTHTFARAQTDPLSRAPQAYRAAYNNFKREEVEAPNLSGLWPQTPFTMVPGQTAFVKREQSVVPDQWMLHGVPYGHHQGGMSRAW
ncbi:uncharacterized protein BXZ73DRAFT_77481 [Epithele typhae]|uniref:uncharacterized protein n=1 Tax=Epithele typhae TaxID=378194 RepID=UPI00200894B7|nr:uncharacterized protein BXZ73DRAFT_77481 [Epithele typhae]KAH9932784.1 hypothetical protein BXZ73DRAFT_77481 [Epithele typhae]